MKLPDFGAKFGHRKSIQLLRLWQTRPTTERRAGDDRPMTETRPTQKKPNFAPKNVRLLRFQHGISSVSCRSIVGYVSRRCLVCGK